MIVESVSNFSRLPTSVSNSCRIHVKEYGWPHKNMFRNNTKNVHKVYPKYIQLYENYIQIYCKIYKIHKIHKMHKKYQAAARRRPWTEARAPGLGRAAAT